MLQLFAVYYGPYYLFGIPITNEYRFTAVIIAFSINYAAYFAEIYRAGIESIPVGQYEAATVLGYNKAQTFLRIVFPQMCKRIMPPVTNETITLVKDTSFAFVISYPEMFTIAKQISAAQTTIMPLIIAGVFYFIFNGIVAFVMDKIEKKVSRGNTGTLTTIASCAIIGVFSAMCASHLSKPFYSMMMKADQITMSGAWKNALACVLGAVIMFVLTKVANKKEIGWLKEWSLTITILGAMIITALV